MKNVLKLEETGLFALSVFLLFQLSIQLSWWLYLILFFSPDIGMLGYIFNTKAGAYTYNIFHHKGVASILLIAGVLNSSNYLLLAGLLTLAHSSFDRIIGYGLKYTDNFKYNSLDTTQ